MQAKTLGMRIQAFENAAEMIRGHSEHGMSDRDCSENLEDYRMECIFVSRMLTRQAELLRRKYLLQHRVLKTHDKV